MDSASARRTKRRKFKKKKQRRGSAFAIGYDPSALRRAQGNIQISKSLTESIVPSMIAEPISNVYSYMDRACVLSMGHDLERGERIKVVNYDWHCKRTGQILYCVMERQDLSANKSRGYKYKMVNRLFTASELLKEYNVRKEEGPGSWRQTEQFRSELAAGEMIERILQEPTERRRLIDSCQWHKVEIHKRQNNKRRLTLSLTKPQFMKQGAEQTLDVMDNVHDVQLVPILMFNSETEARWIEHVWIVSIEEGVSIGIALRNDGLHGGLRVTGIHLDGDYLRQQHELVVPGHPCRCLDAFSSHISDLRIGNPDDLQNKINYYQQVIKVLSQYKEGVKALIKVDPSNLGHFQAIQRQVMQHHGHHSNHQSVQHSQPRFQRHLTPTRMTQSVSRSPSHSPTNAVPPRMQQNLHQNVQHQTAHNVQRHNVQHQNVQNAHHLSIPSGLPHIPSRRYPVHVVNQNYYVHSNQQQNYTVHSVQSQQTQSFAVNAVNGNTVNVQSNGVHGMGHHLNGMKPIHGMYQMH